MPLAGCHAHEQTEQTAASAPIAPTAAAVRMPLQTTLQIAGEFIPYQQTELHAKVSGFIRRINADIGDRVHAGEVLATLDIPELNAQVLGANAGVRQSAEQIGRAQSDVANAEAAYKPLAMSAQRLHQASAARPGLIAQQELDNADAKAGVALAQVQAARSALAATQQNLEVSRASRQQVDAMASYGSIVAPFSGVVTARYADPGALIQAGTSSSGSAPVLTIAEIDKLRLRLPVPAGLAAFVHDGDAVKVRINELGTTFNSTVTRSTDALDPNTRTEQVEVDLPNPNGTIKPGMYATVTLDVHRAGDALAVPITAVDRDGPQPFVLLVDASHHIQRRTVQIGISTANHVQILDGLNPGDQVITANLDTYHAGEAVTPQQSAIPAGGAY